MYWKCIYKRGTTWEAQLGPRKKLLLLRKSKSIPFSFHYFTPSYLWPRYAQYKSHFELVVVGDLTVPSVLDSLLKVTPSILPPLLRCVNINTCTDVVGIIHVAAPVVFQPQSNKDDIIDPAIKNNVAILEAAVRAPNVRRIVFTSSVVAAMDYSGATRTFQSRVLLEAGDSPFFFSKQHPITCILKRIGTQSHMNMLLLFQQAELATWRLRNYRNVQFGNL